MISACPPLIPTHIMSNLMETVSLLTEEEIVLRHIRIDQKPNGKPITIPSEANEANLEQQVKRFIEIADYNTFAGQLHISLFRHFHGGPWTLHILQNVLQELHHPSISLTISSPRDELLPFFEYQLERHTNMSDTEFGFPGDHTRLPI